MAVLDAFDLTGRVAVVTGGNRGLGLAFARALGEAGARVAIAARDSERSAAALAEVRAVSPDAIAVTLDVTNREDVYRMLETVTARLGPVDVLVNNAGACIHRPSLEVTPEQWNEVMRVNLDGVWNCSQIIGEQMVGRRSGVIVNVGSISALIVNRPQWQPAYNSSKAAVHQLTKSLAAEWAPFGVRVNALAPGYMKTEMAQVDEPRFHRYWIEDAPMERCGVPAELAATMVYLASDASAFMTGSILVIDGGYTLF